MERRGWGGGGVIYIWVRTVGHTIYGHVNNLFHIWACAMRNSIYGHVQ